MKKLMSIVVIFAGLYAHAVGINTKSNSNCLSRSKVSLMNNSNPVREKNSSSIPKQSAPVRSRAQGA